MTYLTANDLKEGKQYNEGDELSWEAVQYLNSYLPLVVCEKEGSIHFFAGQVPYSFVGTIIPIPKSKADGWGRLIDRTNLTIEAISKWDEIKNTMELIGAAGAFTTQAAGDFYTGSTWVGDVAPSDPADTLSIGHAVTGAYGTFASATMTAAVQLSLSNTLTLTTFSAYAGCTLAGESSTKTTAITTFNWTSMNLSLITFSNARATSGAGITVSMTGNVTCSSTLTVAAGDYWYTGTSALDITGLNTINGTLRGSSGAATNWSGTWGAGFTLGTAGTLGMPTSNFITLSGTAPITSSGAGNTLLLNGGGFNITGTPTFSTNWSGTNNRLPSITFANAGVCTWSGDANIGNYTDNPQITFNSTQNWSGAYIISFRCNNTTPFVATNMPTSFGGCTFNYVNFSAGTYSIASSTWATIAAWRCVSLATATVNFGAISITGTTGTGSSGSWIRQQTAASTMTVGFTDNFTFSGSGDLQIGASTPASGVVTNATVAAGKTLSMPAAYVYQYCSLAFAVGGILSNSGLLTSTGSVGSANAWVWTCGGFTQTSASATLIAPNGTWIQNGNFVCTAGTLTYQSSTMVVGANISINSSKTLNNITQGNGTIITILTNGAILVGTFTLGDNTSEIAGSASIEFVGAGGFAVGATLPTRSHTGNIVYRPYVSAAQTMVSFPTSSCYVGCNSAVSTTLTLAKTGLDTTLNYAAFAFSSLGVGAHIVDNSVNNLSFSVAAITDSIVSANTFKLGTGTISCTSVTLDETDSFTWEFSTGGTLTCTGAFSCTGSGVVFGKAAIAYNVNVGTNWTFTAGSFVGGTSTLTFNGGVAQAINHDNSKGSLYNLATSGASTAVTQGSAISPAGALTIGSGTTWNTLNVSSWGLTVSGATSVAGSLLGNSSNINLGASVAPSADAVTVNNGGLLDMTAGALTISNVGLSNGLVLNGTCNLGTGTHIIGASSTWWGLSIGSTGVMDEEDAIVSYGPVNIGASATYTAASATGSTTVVGGYGEGVGTNDAWNVDATAVVDYSSGDLYFTRASTQYINNSNATNPWNVVVNNAACILSPRSVAVEIANDLTVTTGEYNTSTYDLEVAGSTSVAAPGALYTNASTVSLGIVTVTGTYAGTAGPVAPTGAHSIKTLTISAVTGVFYGTTGTLTMVGSGGDDTIWNNARGGTAGFINGGAASEVVMTAASTHDVYGDNTWATLEINAPSATYRFESGKTQTCTTWCKMYGSGIGTELTLDSINGTDHWNLLLGPTGPPVCLQLFNYLVVDQSDASTGATCYAHGSTDAGTNHNWVFLSIADTVWTNAGGSGDGNSNTPTNWDNGAPVDGMNAFYSASYDYACNWNTTNTAGTTDVYVYTDFDAAITLANLVLWDDVTLVDGSIVTAGFALTAADLIVSSGATFTGTTSTVTLVTLTIGSASDTANAAMTMSTGSLSCSGLITIGNDAYVSGTYGASLTYTGAGSLTSTVTGTNNACIVGTRGTLSCADLDVQVSLASTCTNWALSIGTNASVDFSHCTTACTIGTLLVGAAATSTFIQSSGTTHITSAYADAALNSIGIGAMSAYTNSSGTFSMDRAGHQAIYNSAVTAFPTIVTNHASNVTHLRYTAATITALTVTLGQFTTRNYEDAADFGLIVSGATSVASGATFYTNGSTIGLESLAVNGVMAGATGPVAPTGSFEASSTISIQSGGTFVATTNATSTVGGNVTVGTSDTATSSTLIVGAGNLNTGANGITVGNTGLGDAVASSVTISTGSLICSALTVTGSVANSGTAVVSFSDVGSLRTDGQVTINTKGTIGSAGVDFTLDMNASLLASAGTLIAPTGTNFTFSGITWNTPTVFTVTGNTCTFDKAGTSILGSSVTFNNFVLDAATSLTTNVTTLTTGGLATIAGVIGNTGPATAWTWVATGGILASGTPTINAPLTGGAWSAADDVDLTGATLNASTSTLTFTDTLVITKATTGDFYSLANTTAGTTTQGSDIVASNLLNCAMPWDVSTYGLDVSTGIDLTAKITADLSSGVTAGYIAIGAAGEYSAPAATEITATKAGVALSTVAGGSPGVLTANSGEITFTGTDDQGISLLGTGNMYDAVVNMTATKTLSPAMNTTIANDLTITSGIFDTTSSDYSLTVGNGAYVDDSMVCNASAVAMKFVIVTGTLDATTDTTTITGANGSNVSWDNGGIINTYTGRVLFNHASVHQILGSTIFYTLEINPGAASTYEFEAGETQTVTNFIKFRGVDPSNLLTVKSTTTDPWYLDVDVSAIQDLAWLDVYDSDASGDDVVSTAFSLDEGATPDPSGVSTNNPNWYFGETTEFIWNNATTDGLASTPGNWAGGNAPTDGKIIHYGSASNDNCNMDIPSVSFYWEISIEYSGTVTVSVDHTFNTLVQANGAVDFGGTAATVAIHNIQQLAGSVDATALSDLTLDGDTVSGSVDVSGVALVQVTDNLIVDGTLDMGLAGVVVTAGKYIQNSSGTIVSPATLDGLGGLGILTESGTPTWTWETGTWTDMDIQFAVVLPGSITITGLGTLNLDGLTVGAASVFDPRGITSLEIIGAIILATGSTFYTPTTGAFTRGSARDLAHIATDDISGTGSLVITEIDPRIRYVVGAGIIVTGVRLSSNSYIRAASIGGLVTRRGEKPKELSEEFAVTL